eukprot:4035308-Pleurochrysis_carterae.AAC.3
MYCMYVDSCIKLYRCTPRTTSDAALLLSAAPRAHQVEQVVGDRCEGRRWLSHCGQVVEHAVSAAEVEGAALCREQHQLGQLRPHLGGRCVQRAHHGESRCERGETRRDEGGGGGVESRGWLVEEQRVRLAHQLHPDGEPLALAARDAALGKRALLAHARRGDRSQLELRHELSAALRRHRRAETAQPTAQLERLAHRQHRKERVMLRNEADA